MARERRRAVGRAVPTPASSGLPESREDLGMESTDRKRTFEEDLRELESTVDSLESGSLSLEDSLKAFERGIGLVRNLTGTLDVAERRIEVLLREDGTGALRVKEIDEDGEA